MNDIEAVKAGQKFKLAVLMNGEIYRHYFASCDTREAFAKRPEVEGLTLHFQTLHSLESVLLDRAEFLSQLAEKITERFAGCVKLAEEASTVCRVQKIPNDVREMMVRRSQDGLMKVLSELDISDILKRLGEIA